VDAQDAPPAGADHACGLDELAAAQGKDVGAGDAGRVEPGEEAEHQHELERAGGEEPETDSFEASAHGVESTMMKSSWGRIMVASVNLETRVSTQPPK
jgi:hypothetical protein